METKAMSAIILAGGNSSRMGQNKLFLPLGPKPLVAHVIELFNAMFAQTVVVTDEPNLFKGFAVDITRDVILDGRKNSLAGIHAGLLTSRYPYAFVAAGDMPFMQPAVVHFLCSLAETHDIIVPQEGPFYQPLCAVYHQRCVPVIEEHLTSGRFRVTELFANVSLLTVDKEILVPFDPELLSFFNVNTPDDYSVARHIYGRQQGEEE